MNHYDRTTVWSESDQSQDYLHDIDSYGGYSRSEQGRLRTQLTCSKDCCEDENYESQSSPDNVIQHIDEPENSAASQDDLDKQHQSDKIRNYPSRLQDTAECDFL